MKTPQLVNGSLLGRCTGTIESRMVGLVILLGITEYSSSDYKERWQFVIDRMSVDENPPVPILTKILINRLQSNFSDLDWVTPEVAIMCGELATTPGASVMLAFTIAHAATVFKSNGGVGPMKLRDLLLLIDKSPSEHDMHITWESQKVNDGAPGDNLLDRKETWAEFKKLLEATKPDLEKAQVS